MNRYSFPKLNNKTIVASASAAVIISGMFFPAAANATESTTPATVEASVITVEANAEAASVDPFVKRVFDLINAERSAKRLAPLKLNTQITAVSQDWANHLAVESTKPNFNQDNVHRPGDWGDLLPSGANWWAEVVSFDVSPEATVRGWMSSTPHRNILMNTNATDVGVGLGIPKTGPYAGSRIAVANLASYKTTEVPIFDSPFNDLTDKHMFVEEMNWMWYNGISTGWMEKTGERNYRPFESVKRDAMAAFMYRLAGSPEFTPPKKSPFSDVSTNNQFYKEIAWLDSTGISTGWQMSNGKREFRPLAPINRDAMAAFMYRMSGSPDVTIPRTTPFSDVSKTNMFYKEIVWMNESGISTGWEVGNKNEYRPIRPIARDAMAAFMKRWHTQFVVTPTPDVPTPGVPEQP